MQVRPLKRSNSKLQISSGVRGIRPTPDIAGRNDLTSDIDTSVLTLSKQGMGKNTLGKGRRFCLYVTVNNSSMKTEIQRLRWTVIESLSVEGKV